MKLGQKACSLESNISALKKSAEGESNRQDLNELLTKALKDLRNRETEYNKRLQELKNCLEKLYKCQSELNSTGKELDDSPLELSRTQSDLNSREKEMSLLKKTWSPKICWN